MSDLTGTKTGEELLQIDNVVELGFKVADGWASYCYALIKYADQKLTIEKEYARELQTMASQMESVFLTKQTFPLHFVYMASIQQDAVFAEQMLRIASDIESKFRKPLKDQLTAHKSAIEGWKGMCFNQNKAMRDAAESVADAKECYMKFSRELERMEEERQRPISTSSGNVLFVNDSDSKKNAAKKKKLEDELSRKVADAKKKYEDCIAKANDQILTEKMFEDNLPGKLNNLVTNSCRVVKDLTENLFSPYEKLLKTSAGNLQICVKMSNTTEVDAFFASEFKKLSKSSTPVNASVKEFVFEPYPKIERSHSSGWQRDSRMRTRYEELPVKKSGKRGKERGEYNFAASVEDEVFDEDPIKPSKNYNRCKSSGASRSVDNSPEPEGRESKEEGQSSSLLDLSIISATTEPANPEEKKITTGRSHTFKRARIPCKCRACETLLCFNGFICTRCSVTCHKKCLPHLTFQCMTTSSTSDQKSSNRKFSTGKFYGQKSSQSTSAAKGDDEASVRANSMMRIIKKCIDYIDENGRDTEGLYRVSGHQARAKTLLQKLLTDKTADYDYLFSIESVQTISCVLKMVLREAQELLFTEDVKERIYRIFTRLKTDEPIGPPALESIKCCLENLPARNSSLLIILFQHFEKMASFQEVTRMSATNFSIVLGPTLISNQFSPQVPEFLDANLVWCRVVKVFIENYRNLFKLEWDEHSEINLTGWVCGDNDYTRVRRSAPLSSSVPEGEEATEDSFKECTDEDLQSL